jgi:NhaA family Na+:H+ antiporter
MSAGVAIEGGGDLLRDPVAIGVLAGLVVGKPIGVLLGTWLTVRLTRAELSGIDWRDLAGVAVLAGVGFTVALLVAELSFTGPEAEAAKTAVLGGSVLSALLAAVLLRRRNRIHAASAG